MAVPTQPDTEVTTELRRESKRYVLEIGLDDGDGLRADAGTDLDRARAQLASIDATGASDAFVFLGQDTVVRSRDIRYVHLREAGGDDESGPGIIDTVKDRVGGRRMSTYGTEQGSTRVTTRRSEDGGSGAFDQPMFGYGRRPWAETKPFFLTSEFLVLAGIITALAIAMGVLDNFDANRGWLLITTIGAAYLVSRGLAKSGSRDPNPDQRYGGGDYR